MAIAPRLDLRQAQSLVMTPQLQQAIKLLQLSNLELTAYVEQELEKNPLLEREDDRLDSLDSAADDEAFSAEDVLSSEDFPGEDFNEDIKSDLSLDSDFISGDDTALDIDIDNNVTGNSQAEDDRLDTGDSGYLVEDWGSGGGSFDSDLSSFEESASEAPSLRQHLLDQITLDMADMQEKMIALHLLDHLGENGFFSGDCADVATTLGCEEESCRHVLSKLKRLDPAGIFAEGLADCLAIQLKDKDRLDPAMQAMLENLDLLAKRDFKTLMRLCGVDMEDLTDMVHEIRALNPRPVDAFAVDVAQPVTPDVLVHRRTDGQYHIELNAQTLPRLLVNSRYHAVIKQSAKSKEDKKYISEQMQAASWLVKTLHQRATTILKVATEIVKIQTDFLEKGVTHLKPLILREIADKIEMHESTVSRVTANKFMATPRGLFELKYFFTQAIAATDGAEAHSAESVRHRIKALIDEEKPEKILSDDAIVAILKEEGMDIARRTVAKYREAMKIPSSVQRRREKRNRL